MFLKIFYLKFHQGALYTVFWDGIITFNMKMCDKYFTFAFFFKQKFSIRWD